MSNTGGGGGGSLVSRYRPEFLYLPDQIGLLVVELLVLRPFRVELHQEVHQLVLISQQYVQDRFRFIRVSNEYLGEAFCVFKLAKTQIFWL